MSTADELRDFMADHGVRVTSDYQGTRKSGDGWEHRAFFFMLDVKEERLISNGSYTAGTAHPTTADPVDIFGSILSDCASVEPYANDDAEEERNMWPQTRSEWPPRWEEWADDLGMLDTSGRTNLRKLADDFRDIMNRRGLLRDRLGITAYSRALDIAQEL